MSKYNAEHAAEWMEKHPYGWYNNEDDYGEDVEETEEEEDNNMKKILLKDFDDGETIGVLTVPETVSLAHAEKEIYKVKNGWYKDNDGGLSLLEYLEKHCPEGWDVELYDDNSDYIEI